MKVKGKKIILGVTGSIAAYKAALLVRLLVKEGAEVKVIMTGSAESFISRLTLSTLSKNQVLSDLSESGSWNNHVAMGLWADLMIVAPASANTISKLANGGCDNLLTAVYLSARCPVCIAPAMDEDMWKHVSTQRNVEQLVKDRVKIIPVDSGELASGLFGEGRMAEPEAIIKFIKDFFEHSGSTSKKKLSGKKALVTAGPTYEAIDPVRFVGNHSSGKMGIAIADALADEGAEVELVLGPSSLHPLNSNVHVLHVTTAAEMFDAATKIFRRSDVAVMAAAVADYAPEHPAEKKIKKKNGSSLKLELVKTKDILKTLGKQKQKKQMLVGFALETNNEIGNAKEKLRKKNLDFIVLNSLNDEGAGFQHATNRITIIDNKGKVFAFDLKSKTEVARDIVNFIIKSLP